MLTRTLLGAAADGVAGLAGYLSLFWALKLLKLPRAWSASGLGCAFWPLVWFAGGYISWTHGVLVVIVVPVLAYALAGALTGFKLSSS